MVGPCELITCKSATVGSTEARELFKEHVYLASVKVWKCYCFHFSGMVCNSSGFCEHMQYSLLLKK